jgi:hypothetical protein
MHTEGIIMLSDLYREIANGLYLVSSQVQQYRARNNHVPVLAAGATKARKMHKAEEVRSGAGWITARRATLILTKEKLVCGSWEIPLVSIKEARLLRVKSMFAKAFVLKVSAEEGYYQFGLQYDPTWENQTALPLIIEDGKINRSPVLSLLRALVWLCLLAMCGLSFWLMFKDLFFGN